MRSSKKFIIQMACRGSHKQEITRRCRSYRDSEGERYKCIGVSPVLQRSHSSHAATRAQSHGYLSHFQHGILTMGCQFHQVCVHTQDDQSSLDSAYSFSHRGVTSSRCTSSTHSFALWFSTLCEGIQSFIQCVLIAKPYTSTISYNGWLEPKALTRIP